MSTLARKSVLVAVLAVLLAAPSAWAFFPIGEFDAYGVLRYVTWRLSVLDTNGDGDVGADEGVEVFIETGPLGFTADEMEVVEQALEVWEDVPTSYAAARIGGEYQDLVLAGVPDGLNTIQMEMELDPSEIQVGVISDPAVLGLTLLNYTVSDAVVTLNGITALVDAGTILDADIVMDGPSHRSLLPGVPPEFDLLGTLVHELGHFYGLDHTPNSSVILDTDLLQIYEIADFRYKNSLGEDTLIGLTPTMFPYYFLSRSRDGTDALTDGASTLAPDDISGLSFLYPRGSQSGFFDLGHKARTQTRDDLPSFPLPGAVITAWMDHDGDPVTARQPVFSTITGLYEPLAKVERAGNFEMLNLWKRIDIEGVEGQVDATYTFTVNALNSMGYDRIAPPPYLVADFTSITGSATVTPPAFLSEVFNEYGNVIDISNHDAGTGLKWDSNIGAVVSAESGNTLADILPNRGEPMFGDPNPICPFNVFSGSGGDTTTTDTTGTDGGKYDGNTIVGSVREFRDDVLLNSFVGAGIVDVYYSYAPALARLVMNNDIAWWVGYALYTVVGLLLMWRLYTVLLLVAFVALAWRLRRRRALLRFVTAAGAAAFLILAVSPAWASTGIPATTADLVRYSDAVVTGTVTTAESRWVTTNFGKYIVTDVVVEVTDTAKGTLNKSSSVAFTLPGGQVDAIKTYASGTAVFAEGEEVILYLVESPKQGYVVVGGSRGKITVSTDKKSGEKYVKADTAEGAVNLGQDAAAIAKRNADAAKAEAQPKHVSLADYMEYLRGLVREEAAAK